MLKVYLLPRVLAQVLFFWQRIPRIKNEKAQIIYKALAIERTKKYEKNGNIFLYVLIFKRVQLMIDYKSLGQS